MNKIELSTREPINTNTKQINLQPSFRSKKSRTETKMQIKINKYKESTNWYWCPHNKKLWVPAKLEKKDNEKSMVMLKQINGDEFCCSINNFNKLTHCEIQTLNVNIDDLANLQEFSDAAVLYQLRKRYFSDQIYTNIGKLLISINPFVRLSQMNNDVILHYRKKTLDKKVIPHMYAVASNALSNIVHTKKNQSIIISGESGSGKTESAKYILLYLSKAVISENNYENIILSSNPILEAFGNAQTIRNANSSRFGKWMEILIDLSSKSYIKMIGASIISYLLEKTRVIRQAKGERNFHIFYILLRGLSKDERIKFHIYESENYNYLNKINIIEQSKKDDIELWNKVKKSFLHMNFSLQEIDNIIRLVSGVLNIGNIKIKEIKNDESEIDDSEELNIVANLLEISPIALKEALISKKREVCGEIIISILSKKKAIENRDSIAKQIYIQLFQWIISKINESVKLTNKKNDKCFSIGILDIFGFENFNKNYFEQFCINYANEKLQQHFSEFIFEQELNEYKKEGLEIEPINYTNSDDVLNLIEDKRFGILEILDEEVRRPNGNDISLLNNLNNINLPPDKQIRNSCYENKNNKEFKICHYADSVTYSIDGFVNKNKDEFPSSLGRYLASSQNVLLSEIFSKYASDSKDIILKENSKFKIKINSTLACQFKSQLGSLMTKIRSTFPFFVRCIKPNIYDQPHKFNSKLVMEQMKNGGLTVAIRVRAQGYAYRKTFDEFIHQYKWCLLKKERENIENLISIKDKAISVINFLQDSKKICKDDLKLGKSKIFYKLEQMQVLEKLRTENFHKIVLKIQTAFRKYLAKKKFKIIKEINRDLLDSISSRKMFKLKKGLQNAFQYRFVKKNLMEQANMLLNDLQIEKIIKDTMKTKNFIIMQKLKNQINTINLKINDCKVKETFEMFQKELIYLEKKNRELKTIKRESEFIDHSDICVKDNQVDTKSYELQQNILEKKFNIICNEVKLGLEIKIAIENKNLTKINELFNKNKGETYFHDSMMKIIDKMLCFKEYLEIEKNKSGKEKIDKIKTLKVNSSNYEKKQDKSIINDLERKNKERSISKSIDEDRIYETTLEIENSINSKYIFALFNKLKIINYLCDHSRIRIKNDDKKWKRNSKRFYQFQKTNIYSPMLLLSRKLSKNYCIYEYYSIEAFKCILRYMISDKKRIKNLKKFCRIGIMQPIMRDELYSHLIKQTTNVKNNLLIRGLKMLYISLKSFYPSPEMTSILLSHLARIIDLTKVIWNKIDFSTVNNCGISCFFILNKQISYLCSSTNLSKAELKSITLNESIKVDVYLLDGSLFIYKIDPLSSRLLVVKDLINSILNRIDSAFETRSIDRKNFKNKFGIYLYFTKFDTSNKYEGTNIKSPLFKLGFMKYLNENLTISRCLKMIEKAKYNRLKYGELNPTLVFQFNNITTHDCVYPDSNYWDYLIYVQVKMLLMKINKTNEELNRCLPNILAYQLLIEKKYKKINECVPIKSICLISLNIPKCAISIFNENKWIKVINEELMKISKEYYSVDIFKLKSEMIRKYNEKCSHLLFEKSN